MFRLLTACLYLYLIAGAYSRAVASNSYTNGYQLTIFKPLAMPLQNCSKALLPVQVSHKTLELVLADWYSRGDHAWDVLCNDDNVRARANEWLKRMKIHYEIKPRIWRTTGEQKRELALVDTRNGTTVSHRDIGVGVSQMLPIIATACGSQNQIHGNPAFSHGSPHDALSNHPRTSLDSIMRVATHATDSVKCAVP